MARVQATPVVVEVVVTEKPRAHCVGQLDHFDAVGGNVLGAGVEPDAVGLLEGAGPASDVVCGIEYMQVHVPEQIGGSQARDSSPQNRHVEPVHHPPPICGREGHLYDTRTNRSSPGLSNQ